MSWINYAACILLGINFAHVYLSFTPNENYGVIHEILKLNYTTFLGALLGSEFYNLTHPIVVVD